MLAEAASLTLLTVQAAAASFLMAVLPADQAELMAWTLLPMIGATLAAGGAFCLNTQQEVRRIVVGRCLFTIVVGVVGPRMMSMAHPWLAGMMADPLLKVGAGFAHGFCGYVLSWPFVKSAYERAPVIAAQQVRAIETRIADQVAVRVATDAKQAAVGVAVELSKTEQPTPTVSQMATALAHAAKDDLSPQPSTTKLTP